MELITTQDIDTITFDPAELTLGTKKDPSHGRFGFNKTWHSRWFAGKKEAEALHRDLKLRDDLKKRFSHAGVSEIDIERTANKMRVNIYASRPGIIIGRKGAELHKLRDELLKLVNEVYINIQEIRRPELDAQLVAENIATQLERRIASRRAMKKAMESAFRFGAKGIKIRLSGPLNGAESARTEWYQDGRLPIHTLKAEIDHGRAEAHTAYGVVGVKVWLYKGEIKSRRRIGDGPSISAVAKKRRDDVQAEMQRMIASMIPPSTVPLPAQVLQARRNAEARESLLREFGALKSTDIGEVAGSKATNRAALAHKWKSDHRIFSVTHGNGTYFPGFQFTGEGQPLRVIADILAILGPVRTDWELALWFTRSNGWLGGQRPVDLLLKLPEQIVEAARHEAEDRVF
jgi:small subunit ribosomal protein S3